MTKALIVSWLRARERQTLLLLIVLRTAKKLDQVYCDAGWYLMVLGQYMATFMVLGHFRLVVLGTWWYRVSIVLLCLVILKKWRFVRVLPKRYTLTDNKICLYKAQTFSWGTQGGQKENIFWGEKEKKKRRNYLTSLLGEENEQEELRSENETKLQAKHLCWQKSNTLAKTTLPKGQKHKNAKLVWDCAF